MARTVTIKVLVEPGEQDTIRAAAKRADRSMSDYLRLVGLAAAEKGDNPDERRVPKNRRA